MNPKQITDEIRKLKTRITILQNAMTKKDKETYFNVTKEVDVSFLYDKR